MQTNLKPHAILPQSITRTIVLYMDQIGCPKHLVLQIFLVFVHLGGALIYIYLDNNFDEIHVDNTNIA
jgi:hypothetical protein